ncbi:MAG: P-loop NTPase [Promethearchaeota archaeon]
MAFQSRNHDKKKIFHCVVISGKGGVGKTSITASLATLIYEQKINIIATDADVDAPNLAILFQARGDPIESFYVQTAEKAEFIEDKCIHCKNCIDDEFCHFNALSWDEEKLQPIVDTITCEGCKACHYLCSEHAFIIKPVNSGSISHLKSEYGFSVITGETILGAQTSGKLVTEMKQYSDKIARQNDIDFVLIDGPPGIGCPVIAAVSETQYAIVIIEPTTAALHDAQRMMHIIQNFNIPFGVIINKADMWVESCVEIENFLKENNIELLGKLYLDKDWPFAIANGIPIVKYRPNNQSAKLLKEISKKIIKKYKDWID